MGDADFKNAIEVISKVIDGVGVVVIALGLLLATGAFALAQRGSNERPLAYRLYRQQVGKAILLGLEFLVACGHEPHGGCRPSFAALASQPSSSRSVHS